MTTAPELPAPRRTWLSYSQLTTHRVCPQKWMYGYVRRLEKADPEDVKVELETGLWWHALLAADSLYRGRLHDSLKVLPKPLQAVDDAEPLDPERVMVEDVLVSAADWWHKQTPLKQETYVERLGEALVPRLETMFQRWCERWADERETEHPLAVELDWRRDLPGTDVTLVGYADEVYLDTRRRLVVVRDHKAHRSLGTQSVADDMMDSQLQFYAWGASPTVTSWDVGPVRATAYDRVRMVKAKSPQITQMGSLSKAVSDYDLATYLEWAKGEYGLGVPYPGRKQDGSQAGRYEVEPAVVERLSAPSSLSAWHQRTLSPLNGSLIRVHLHSAVDSAKDLAASRDRAERTHEAARNLTSGCRWCDFAGLCRAEMVGGPDGEYELSDFKLRLRS